MRGLFVYYSVDQVHQRDCFTPTNYFAIKTYIKWILIFVQNVSAPKYFAEGITLPPVAAICSGIDTGR
jgi:hypothetical protein